MGKIFAFFLLVLNISWSYQDDHHHEIHSPVNISVKGCFSSEDVAAKLLYYIHSEVTLTAIPPPFSDTFDLHIKRTTWSIISIPDGEKEIDTEGSLLLKIPPFTFKKTGVKKVNIDVTYTNKFLGEGVPEKHIQYTCFISIDKRPIYFYVKTPRQKVIPCNRPFEVKLGISKAVMHEYKARIKCDYQSDFCKERMLANFQTTYSSLPCDKLIKFTASAKHQKISKLFEITFKLQTSKDAKSDLELRCMSNCGLKIAQGKPFELHLYENPPTNSQIKWTITVNDEVIDSSRFVNEHKPNILLMADPQFQKAAYVVVMAEQRSSIIMYTAEMNELPSKGNCEVSPDKGTSLTVYQIICFGISDPDPLQFSLYQIIGSKRILLMSTLIPYFQDITLSSDTILVVVHDSFAEISLDPVKIDFEKIQGPTLQHLFSSNDLDPEMILHKLIAFTLQNPNMTESTKLEILKKMATLDFYNSHIQAQGTELLSILISDMNNTVDAHIFYGLSYTLEKLMGQILHISTIQIEQEDEESKHKFTDTLITVFGVISTLRDSLVLNISYPSDFTHIHYRKVKESMNLFIKAIEDLIEFIAIQNINYVKSFEKMWVNVITVRCFDLFNTTIQDPSGLIKVSFNKAFVAQHCQSGSLTIGVACLVEEVMWWNEEFEQITPSITIAFWNATTMARLVNLHKPFDIYLKVKTEIKPEVSVLNIKPIPGGLTLNEMDDAVTLLVFHFEKNVGTMSFTFDKYEDVKVLVTQDMRPSFKILSKTTALQAQNLTFKINRNKKLTIVYLSILPTKNVTSTMKLTVQISHLACSIWHKGRMNSSFCSAQLKNNVIHCQCSHLSFIAASFFTAPHYVNNLLEEPLSIVLQKNYSLLIFPAVVTLIFLLTFLLMVYQQMYTKFEKSIEILRDNFPGDEFPYLVSVYSGKIFSRANTAHVAIRLFGTKAVSRIHILEKQTGKVLQPSMDDWFIVFTKEPLGEVKTVEIWYDDFGHNPEWFCIKIIIYDLKNSEYHFPIKKWFSIFDIIKHSTSHKFKINNVPDSTNNCNIARKDFYRHLREQHRHISIFTRHPRSAFTVIEKLLLCLTFFSIHMMINIMFFGVHSRSPIVVSQSQMTVFMIALESTIITIFLSNLLMIFFKKSKSDCFQGEVLSQNYKLLMEKSASIFHKLLINIYGPKMFMSLRVKRESHPINIWTYFSWFTSFAIFFACISVVTLFILDFGGQKTFHWIANFILALFQQFFIEPIFIFVSIFITSIICKMTFIEKIKMYKIERDQTWKKSKKMITMVHLRLLQLRIKAFYTKNFMKFKEEIYEKKLDRMRFLKFKIELGTLVTFFIILAFLVFSLSIQEKNYMISNLKSFIEYQTKASESSVLDVISHDRLADYLIEKLIPALHNLDWYNARHLPLERMDAKVPGKKQRRDTVQKGFTKDYVSKIIGKPRIAQRRVKPDYYYGVSSYWKNLFNRSYSRLNMFSEDTRPYLPSWKAYDPDIEEIWNHTIYNYYPSRLYTGLHIGGSREIYKIKDGYVILLSTFGGESLKKIIDLSLDNFFNNFTRIIYIEFYLTSINSKLLAQVLLSLEHFSNGVYIPKLQLEAINMDATVPSTSVLLSMCCLSVIGVIFIILSMRKILRFDLTQSIKSIYSINSTMIAVFTLCSILFFIMRWTTLNLSIDEYVESYVSDYISFLIPTEMDFKFQVAIGILCCLISLQFTKYKPTILGEDSIIASTFFHRSTVFFMFVLYTVVIIAVFLSSNMWIDYQQTFCFDQDFSLHDDTNTSKFNRIFNLTWMSIMFMGYIIGGMLVGTIIRKHRQRFRLDTEYHQLFTETKNNRIFRRRVHNNSLTFRRHLLQMKMSHLLNQPKHV